MIDVVICAHNEAPSIGAVLDAVAGAPSAGRVIVVADACTDQTADVATAHGAGVVSIDAHDKGSAMAAGLDAVTTPDVLFIDADLDGLEPAHVEALLTAAPHGGQVVGLREYQPPRLPPISGERRLPAAVARGASLAGSGYGAEVRLDAAVGRAGLPWRHYRMKGVSNPTRVLAEPVSWVAMWLAVLGTALLFAPELVSYSLHPDGVA